MNNLDGVTIYEDGKCIGVWNPPRSGYGRLEIKWKDGHVVNVEDCNNTKVGRD